MKYYELTYLIPTELSEEEIKSLQEKINSSIQEEGGILTEITGFNKKMLSFGEGNLSYLATLNFQLSPEKIAGLEKKLKSENQILRYFLMAKKAARLAEIAKKPPRFPKKIVKPKVELKEIEKKLEEILGE